MQQEDFYKPTSIRDTIFAGIDLPEESKIQKPSNKNNKYEQEDQDDGFDLGLTGLGEISNIQPKSKYQPSLSIIKEASDITKEQSIGIITRANSTQRSTSSQKSENQQPSVIIKKAPQQVRRAPANLKGKKDTKKPQLKNSIDLDQEIGEVRQWAHRDDQEKSSDFDNSDQQDNYEEPKANRELQDELRKKASEKAKILSMKIENKSGGSQPKGLGLKAKAQELRKKNEDQNKTVTNVEYEHRLQQSTDNLNIRPKTIEQKVSKKETSTIQKTAIIKAPIVKPKIQTELQQQSEDDPWQKINEKTKKQYQKKQERQANSLTKEEVIEFYSKKFVFAEEDIEVQFELDNAAEEQIPGCWDALFGCFKSKNKDEEEDKKNHKNTKDRLALRLVAISKISMNNTDEEFFVLKEIWSQLTNKPFSRYGNHWNDIGFQGRDPATDLRSTGFLSLLQWYLFIDQNQSQAKKIYEWTVEKDFPLALTHIKATGMFLKLVKNGKIRAKSWNEYQKYYNCIAWSVFNRIQKGYDESQNVGEVVDKNLQSVKKSLAHCMKQYDQTRKD